MGGFEPAVVTETSRNNFQAWLNHGKASLERPTLETLTQGVMPLTKEDVATKAGYEAKWRGFSDAQERLQTGAGSLGELRASTDLFRLKSSVKASRIS